MSDISASIKPYCKGAFPVRLQKFYESEYEEFNESILGNLPGWDPNNTFYVNFDLETFKKLQDRHKDWLERESKEDGCQYIGFSPLVDEEYEDELTDFLAVNISNESCPVYFGNHETGDFSVMYETLDAFLEVLKDDITNPMELFPSYYEKSKEANSDSDYEVVVELLGGFFDKYHIDPAVPSPFMQQIPDALNLLGIAYFELDREEEAIETLNEACKGVFCKHAFLNRVKFNILAENYDVAIEQCEIGLKKYSDDFTQSFLNLYKGVAYLCLEKKEEALTYFALMKGDVTKEDESIIIPFTGFYTHYMEVDDFEKLFNTVTEMLQED